MTNRPGDGKVDMSGLKSDDPQDREGSNPSQATRYPQQGDEA